MGWAHEERKRRREIKRPPLPPRRGAGEKEERESWRERKRESVSARGGGWERDLLLEKPFLRRHA